MKTSIADRQRKANPEACPVRRTNVAIGVDLGDPFSEICVLDEEGQVASQTRLPTTQGALQEYFRSHAPARVPLETGTHSGWGLRPSKTVVPTPTRNPAAAAASKSHDNLQLDARRLRDGSIANSKKARMAPAGIIMIPLRSPYE